MKTVLSDLERAVSECKRMRLKEQDALAYLHKNGFKIKHTKYYKIRNELDRLKLKRLHAIGQYGFEDQHLERIDTLEFVTAELHKRYMNEKDNFKAAKILKMLADVQPYLSAYYEATKMVIESNGNREKSIDLSVLGRGSEEQTQNQLA